MDIKLPTIAHHIRTARIRYNLTREALSELVGVSTKSIQRYEEAKQMPRLHTLEKLGAVLGLSVEAFFRPLYHGDLPSEEVPSGVPAGLADLARIQQQILVRLDSLSAAVNRLVHLIERRADEP